MGTYLVRFVKRGTMLTLRFPSMLEMGDGIEEMSRDGWGVIGFSFIPNKERSGNAVQVASLAI